MTREGLKEISRGSPLPSLRPPLFPPLVSNNLYLFMLHLCYMIPYRAYFCLMNNINVGTVCISYARLLHVFVNPSLLHLYHWLLYYIPPPSLGECGGDSRRGSSWREDHSSEEYSGRGCGRLSVCPESVGVSEDRSPCIHDPQRPSA